MVYALDIYMIQMPLKTQLKQELSLYLYPKNVCHPELLINGWTPAIQTPPESKDVQVTFASYYPPHNPLIVAFAYFHNGKWYWSDNNGQVGVKILDWKINDKVYDSEADLEREYQEGQEMIVYCYWCR